MNLCIFPLQIISFLIKHVAKKNDSVPKNAHQLLLAYPWIVVRLWWQNRNARFWPMAKIMFLSTLLLPLTVLNALVIRCRLLFTPPIKLPLFVLGHWRSGTTYLHYLLAIDDRFHYLSYYQAFVPNLYPIGGSFLKRIVAAQTPSKRPQDNMRVEVSLPTEEENPVATFSTRSASQSFFFPQNESYFDKYALFKDISAHEKKRWQRAYHHMLRRIQISNPKKKLLIKNPHNTGRYPELLELYPDAECIHIHRGPEETYPSTKLMYDKVVTTQFLQDYSDSSLQDKIIYYYKSMMGRFLEKRSLYGKRIFDISYEQFVQDPLPIIKDMYAYFNWTLSEETETKMQAYIDSKKGYKKNRHVLSSEIEARISSEWQPIYEQLHQTADSSE